ncbi:hypothetical protein K493DRAFT_295577 [Basidiobolus meristosporus CBS 931.73]|uniref:Uncharacterized protein n=1 Tax=Basidiobolus meristosporus CBS 931.73 TaxID=1314790 RepID=A0A1Y1ZAR0_9FUNG|nr:hypothetical protein K493DRAFT_295577 [Basidiobolus meristosporus CBS 931.73]|eukprot:ORY07370.1 hypothetical protein K493DRAFT_295577 [Basidiobolus meristosporus CBS 931.73]
MEAGSSQVDARSEGRVQRKQGRGQGCGRGRGTGRGRGRGQGSGQIQEEREGGVAANMDDAEQVAVVTTRRPVNQVSQALSEVRQELPEYRTTLHHEILRRMCQEIKQRRGDIVKLNRDIAGLQAQIDFSFHHSTEALVAQMVEKFARIRASDEQDASSDPGVLASNSIGGDTTFSLEPTTGQETRAESSTTMRMAPTQVDMEVCEEDVEKQSGDTIGQPETVMEAERPSHIVILKIPQVDSSLSLPPSSLSVPPSPPPSSG